jgi:hypothetical protein
MSDESQTKPSDDSELLRQFLSTRDVPCPVCGYNLRGSQSPNCSECGASIDLRIGSSDLRLGPWLTTLLGSALPLGFFSVACIGVWISFWVQNIQNPFARQAHLEIALKLSACVASYTFQLFLVVLQRRWFVRNSRRVQTTIAAICVVLNVLVAYLGFVEFL